MSRARSRYGVDSATLPLWASDAPAPSPAESSPAAARSRTSAEGTASDEAISQRAAGVAIGRDAPEQWLAQEFSNRLVTWAAAAGADAGTFDTLAAAGYALSLATASGHACIRLQELATDGSDAHRVRAALLASRMVTAAEAPHAAAPLVLDSDARLYLHRYFEYERRISERLMRCVAPVLNGAAEQQLATRLEELFARNTAVSGDEIDWQKLAAALAVLNPFTVISGGPGTGKTTTVVNLLACLSDLEPDCRIALAAPTGKAAARMQDAVRQRAVHLPTRIRERLPDESFTIHRLLGVAPGGGEFLHHAANPLPYDVVVIDEASMLDLALAAKLFDAVPESARIVLLGDKDQLAAVESGAVFSELSADPGLSAECAARLSRICGVPLSRIVASSSAARAPLHDSVVWLTHNFRFDTGSGIGRLAQAIKEGATEAVLQGSTSAQDSSVSWIDDGGRTLHPDSLMRLIEGYAPYLSALGASVRERHAIFDAFDRYRILCAQREGPRGVRMVNELLTRRCREAVEATWPSSPRSQWHVGRPVMVLRNDYVLKLYNGDVGIALPDDTGALAVYFRETDGSLRPIAPMRLPEHETAFATTVHKAQGSEFDDVALVLPSAPSAVLTRELVYTAITRARHRVTLIATAEMVQSAIATPTLRHSGLLARLEQARRARESP